MAEMGPALNLVCAAGHTALPALALPEHILVDKDKPFGSTHPLAATGLETKVPGQPGIEYTFSTSLFPALKECVVPYLMLSDPLFTVFKQ